MRKISFVVVLSLVAMILTAGMVSAGASEGEKGFRTCYRYASPKEARQWRFKK